MAIGVGRVGWRDGGPIPRTTLFKDATGITDLTIINALKDLDAGLISTGLDAKIKYLYPFVGSTGDTCKVNFMSPGTKDLTFSGGWTFTSKGIKGNGVNTYANTGIIPATNLSQNDVHASIYTSTSGGIGSGVGVGADFWGGVSGWNAISISSGYTVSLQLNSAWSTLGHPAYLNDTVLKSARKGMRLITRNNGNQFKFYKDGVFYNAPVTYGGVGSNSIFIEGQATSTSGSPTTWPIWIGAVVTQNEGMFDFSNKEYSFATFGKNLTDTEQAALFILVQNFQYALGRIMGTRVVAPVYGIYNTLTQQMVSKFNLTDTTVINACNNLEQSFIDNGILPLIDVMYLMVGGTSDTCAYNFMGNRWYDLDFFGGWTFASTGAKPNGVNGIATTNWSPYFDTNAGNSNGAFGIYLRTTSKAWATPLYVQSGFGIYVDHTPTSLMVYVNNTSGNPIANNNLLGFTQASRNGSDQLCVYTKNTQYTLTNGTSTGKSSGNLTLGGYYYNGGFDVFGNQETSFLYLAKGQITQAQQATINTIVNTFQTALSRNV
jgi:hypothetical protein